MKLALLQFPVVWENKKTNLEIITQKINHLPDDVDLVILPEMFTTGFTMRPESVAETKKNTTLHLLQELAQKEKIAITGSWVTEEAGNYYNRLYFIFPDGSYKTYNKRHLFTLAGEEKVYRPGHEKLVISYKNWNICPLICYDLRFPVYSRIVNQNYDLLIYVASWPDKRIYAWDSLLKARAIENMSYVAGVNRCGQDAAGLNYSGHSQVLDYMGNYLVPPASAEETLIAILEKEPLQKAREKLAFLNDADRFNLI